MIQHIPPEMDHAESPERIVAIEGMLKGHSYTKSVRFVEVNHELGFASLHPIRDQANSLWSRCTTKLTRRLLDNDTMIAEYGEKNVEDWKSIIANIGKTSIEEGDNYWTSQTLIVARLAAQSAIQAARDILSGETQNAFCLIRPPGHHCFQTASGFCIMNNVVLAAKEFLNVGKRVAIIDWDYHFGDGTAKRFATNENVMFVSLHAKKTQTGLPTYPPNDGYDLKGDGLANYTKGRMWNIQWETDDADDVAWQHAFESNILPRIQTWSPDVILISAGYDAVKGDDLAGMEVSPTQFHRCTSLLLTLGLPLLAVLEGGYNPQLLGECVMATVRGMLGDPVSFQNNPILKPQHRLVIEKANQIQLGVSILPVNG